MLGRCSRRECYADLDAAIVQLRQKLAAQLGEGPGRNCEQGRSNDHYAPAPSQGHWQQLGVNRAQADNRTTEGAHREAGFQAAPETDLAGERGQGGYQGESGEQSRDDGKGDRQDHFAKHQRCNPADQQEGQYGSKIGQGARGDRRHHLAGAVAGRFVRGFAQCIAMAVDIFQHHDSVIQQQPHTQGQAAHADDIQRQAAHPHQAEGSHERNRDRKTDNEALAQAPQEQENHEHGQSAADQRCSAYAGEGAADEVGRVLGRTKTYVRWNEAAAVQLCQRVAHRISHGHGVRIRQLVDGNLGGRTPVEAGEYPLPPTAVIHLGDIVQTDIAAIAGNLARQRKQQVLDLFERGETTFGLGCDIKLVGGDPANRRVAILRRQCRADVTHRYAIGEQPLLIDYHLDLAHHPACRFHRGHAGYADELGCQRIFDPVVDGGFIADGRAEAALPYSLLAGIELAHPGWVNVG